MSFTEAQLARVGDYIIPHHLANEPVDQVNQARPLYNWFMRHAETWDGAGGYITENLYVDNESNGQDYFGADQVGYNTRDPVRQTNWRWYNYHQGFGFDEDTLRAAGIFIDDNSDGVVTVAEKRILANLFKQSLRAMKNGTEEDLDLRFHLDGTQSTKAAPGLDFLVSTDPDAGVIGGLSAVDYDYWRNNVFPDIDVTTPANGNINKAMKSAERANLLHGKKVTNAIFAGKAYIEALEAENRAIHHANVNTTGKTGTDYDGGVARTFFNGKEVIWDPTFEIMDALYGPLTVPWTNRAYMLNSESLRIRPLSKDWMRQRMPRRMHDRYVHYRAMTSKYSQTTNQRNANSVLWIDA